MIGLPKKYWRYRRQAVSRRQFTKSALAGAVASLVRPVWGRNPHGAATPPGGGGATLIFNYPNFSGSPSVHPTGNVAISGGAVSLTDGTSHHGGGLWYNTVQNIQSFSTTFTFNVFGVSSYGMFFVIQNSNSSTNPLSGFGIGQGACSANGMGYGGGGGSSQAACCNSIGIKFAVDAFNTTGPTDCYVGTPQSGTGLYVDGGSQIGSTGSVNGFGPENDLHLFNVNVGSNNPIQAVVTYDGTILTMVLTDTVVGTSARMSWPVNIPAIVGANTAYVGFLSASPTNSAGVNTVNSWSWSQGINTRLSTPTFSVTPGQYTGTQSVSLSASAGATIYYTTNGLPPAPGGTGTSTYAGTPISVSATQIVQAVAAQSNFTDSSVAQGYYQIQSGSTPFINFPSGFASAGGLIQPNGYAEITSGSIVLGDTTGTFECASAWAVPQVNVASFNTTFGLNMTSVSGPFSTPSDGGGVAFVLQNYPQTNTGTNYNWTLGIGAFGTYAVTGGPFTLSGTTATTSFYNAGTTGIFNSVALVFDYTNGSGNLVGLYQNGVQPTGSSIDMTGSGVSLRGGHLLSVNLAYSGTTLALTVTDTVTSAQFTHSFTGIDIPSIVGASEAWAGFTCTNGYFGANVKIPTWTY